MPYLQDSPFVDFLFHLMIWQDKEVIPFFPVENKNVVDIACIMALEGYLSHIKHIGIKTVEVGGLHLDAEKVS